MGQTAPQFTMLQFCQLLATQNEQFKGWIFPPNQVGVSLLTKLKRYLQFSLLVLSERKTVGDRPEVLTEEILPISHL